MIVCKFGGTSLSDAVQIKKVVSIMREDPRRRVMVVSAPGKRHANDTKVTDLLYQMAELAFCRLETDAVFQVFEERLQETIYDLGLDGDLASSLLRTLETRLSRKDLSKEAFFDQIVAFGETCSARIITRYLNVNHLPARFVDPVAGGLLLHRVQGHTVIDDKSYQKLGESLQPKKDGEIIVMPGFYGGDERGHIVTFSRGGSDISGAVAAAAIDAELYEVWSDVDHVYAVHPGLVHHPCPIHEMSYREMRELAYIGFTIVHPEALQPVFDKRIPISVKNTNQPNGAGTNIVHERGPIVHPVTGIAAADHFCAVSMRRVLSNPQVGVLASILNIFADEDISIEHAPTGIDSVSIVIREVNFPPEKEERVVHRLIHELGFSPVVARNLSAVMLVGEGMLDSITVVSRAAEALASQRISVEVMLQDYYEISILFMMSEAERERAVPALYQEFFSTCPD